MHVYPKTLRRLIGRSVLALGVLWCSFAVVSHAQTVPDSVRIGVLAKRGIARCLQKWEPTAEYLTQEIRGYSFTIVPLGYHDIYSAVEQEEVDFILANPSLYVGMEKHHGASRILTLKNLRLGRVYTVFGGVIFRRADRTDIEHLADLKGKSFMAVHEMSFGGWQMAWREMKEHDIYPYSDFAGLDFCGSHDAVIYAVRDGVVDAGCVRTDALERMAMEGKIHLGDFQVFHEHAGDDTDMPFLHSTRFYPEWPLAKIRHTSDELAEKVAVALLRMPPDSRATQAARCAGWTIPHNYQPVHECLKYLRIDPYVDYGKVTFRDVLLQYWHWLSAAFVAAVLIVLFAAYVVRLNRRLRRTGGALRETRDYLDNLIGYANAPIIVWNPDKKITLFNRAFENLTGRNADDVIGHPLSILFPDGTRDESLSLIEQTASGRYWDAVEIPILSRDGEIHIVLWNSANLYAADGTTLVATIAQGQDITERKQVEEKVIKKSKELESFTYMVSHDLKNPVVSIQGFCSILAKKYRKDLDDKALFYIERVQANARLMAGLIEDLLELARIGRIKSVKREISIPDVLESVQASMNEALPIGDGEFIVVGNLPKVFYSEKRLYQVFYNLLSNAVKFRSQDRNLRVEIGCQENRDKHILYVRDNGIGIEQKHREKIFDFFTQLKNIKSEGAGMGLSIVKKIVEANSGEVWVESQKGAGTTFYFTIPQKV